MEELHHELWIVHAVNDIFGPVAATLLSPLGYSFGPEETVIPDYLVMAAWLAYLKSRLLLPDLGGEDEPSGEEMAAALAIQLRRLEAMRDAGARLMARVLRSAAAAGMVGSPSTKTR